MKIGQRIIYTSGSHGKIIKQLKKSSKEFKNLDYDYENTFGSLWSQEAVGSGKIYKVKLDDGDIILAYEDELTLEGPFVKPVYKFSKWR